MPTPLNRGSIGSHHVRRQCAQALREAKRQLAGDGKVRHGPRAPNIRERAHTAPLSDEGQPKQSKDRGARAGQRRAAGIPTTRRSGNNLLAQGPYRPETRAAYV